MVHKLLIAYFSRAGFNYVSGKIENLAVGNTEIVAKKIAALTKGDVFKIERAVPYSEDYVSCTKEAAAELKANARPELAKNLTSIDQYDIIILAYPNYCGTMPMPVWTFLDSFDFSGKCFLPLCTHEGSGMGNSEKDLARLCPTAKKGPGLAIFGHDANTCDAKLKAWLIKNELL